jgi:uncharacterized protein with PIN domain
MITHRYAVDKMLGRLATWLRLIGQDATYGSHLGGQNLIRQARTEGRTIVTRDHRVLRAASGLVVVFITSDDFREQLDQVIRSCHLDPVAALFTRCARCNTLVVAALKSEVATQVPPYVFATQERFVRCPRCFRIYWPGTHYDRVREQLRAMGYHIPPQG